MPNYIDAYLSLPVFALKQAYRNTQTNRHNKYNLKVWNYYRKYVFMYIFENTL